MLFKKEKDEQGTRLFINRLKVYELKKTKTRNSTYILGIKVRSKRRKGLINAKKRQIIEQKIRDLADRYRNLPTENKHILCFDCLYDPLAEAVDAWSLFEYMQSQGIPSRYALLTSNPLYEQLKLQNKLQDILPVDNEVDLLMRYPEEIAHSSRIFFSFPFTCSRILLELPNCPFIFIEHGVNFLKPWSIRLYTEGGESECNYILAPSRLTKELYENMGVMPNKAIYCGLPRWDRLLPHQHNGQRRNIFVFFTWRTSFIHDRSLLDVYTKRIAAFLEALHVLIQNKSYITLNIALHHSFLYHNPKFDFSQLSHANIISTHDVSSMISKTDLFITDYSSVCFDHMYRDVPIIFYRFDADLSYSNPMDKEAAESASAKDSVFYNCCYDMQKALDLTQQYINNDFHLEEEYEKVNERIFWRRKDNCLTLSKLTEGLNN